MSALRGAVAWVARWQHALVYVAITAVFVLTVSGIADLRREDARIEREAAIRFCEAGNERTAVLRDFLAPSIAEPDPAQFDFIPDPALRAGVLDQTRRSRADMRARVDRTFTLRDCAAEFPPPPGEDG